MAVYHGNEKSANSLVKEIETFGGVVKTLKADVAVQYITDTQKNIHTYLFIFSKFSKRSCPDIRF